MKDRSIKSDEVASHDSKDDLWISLRGKVYDITTFSDHHPGGATVLYESAGTDATEAFDYVGHSIDAEKTLVLYQIGVLNGYSDESSKPMTVLEYITEAPTTTQLKTRGANATMVLSSIVGIMVAAGFIRWSSTQLWARPSTNLPPSADQSASNTLRTPLFWICMGACTVSAALLRFAVVVTMEFRKTFVRHKDVREYRPYYPYSSKSQR